MVTVSKKQEGTCFSLFCHVLLPCAMPFLFSWNGLVEKGFELSHVLFKHSSVNKMLVGAWQANHAAC